jgi:hypothetical protein
VLETVRSLGRRRLEPREAQDDAPLIRHLPYVIALTEDVLMLRDGEIMATFAVDGIAAATAESVLVGDVADAVQAVVAQATPDLGFYLHRVSFVADARLSTPLDADPFCFEVDRRWQAALTAMDLRERRSFLTVVVRPQKILGLSTRLFGAGAAAQRNRTLPISPALPPSADGRRAGSRAEGPSCQGHPGSPESSLLGADADPQALTPKAAHPDAAALSFSHHFSYCSLISLSGNQLTGCSCMPGGLATTTRIGGRRG